jgi:hypothetical protein
MWSMSRAQGTEMLLAEGRAWIMGITKGGVSESDGGMLYTIPESSQHGRVASNWCRGQAAHIQLRHGGVFQYYVPSCEISGISEFSY